MTQSFKNNRILIALSAAAFAAAIPAIPAMASSPAAMMAANSVQLTSEAFIERTEVAADGSEKTVTKRPQDVIVIPGDRVLFKLAYSNKGNEAASDFRAVNPMPAPVRFVSATEDWAEVSVDGGKSWGKLETLTVAATNADGSAASRAATPEDVTHVRWVFAAPIAAGASGTLSYRGVIK
ncbi:MAG: hypothetical protein ACK450_05115 [Sphingomonadales bacterium]|jgi:hypothetical protein